MEVLSLRKFLRQTTVLAAGALCGVLYIGINGAQADDFVIDTPVVVTNGGNLVDGNDTITITASGSVITGGALAIFATGTNNTITNSGSIATTGILSNGIEANNANAITNNGSIVTNLDGSAGIFADDDNTISNNDSITTTARASTGIFADDNNTITNTGSIATTGGIGGLSYGIRADDSNTITNTGSIATTGDVSSGILAVSNNTITNSGSIATTGVLSRGIEADDDNTITNNGSIATTGIGAVGIFAGDNNTITNSGSITTAGGFAEGIRADDGNTITNSGLVVSAQDDAVELDTNNTLNLNAPSFVGGAFNLGTNTTLNITTGASHSILWTFDTTQLNGGAPTIAGVVPVFQQTVGTTLQVATFDPTVFAASSDALAQLSGSLSGLIGQRLEGNGTRQINSNLNSFVATSESKSSARINTAFEEASSSFAPVEAPAAWLSVFGSRAGYDATSATTAYDLGQWGIVGGYDWSPSGDLKVGIMGGYAQSNLDANSRFANTYDNDTSGFFAGVYGRKNMGVSYINFAFTGGVTDTRQTRFVNDNLAALGVSSATSDYNSYWVSPEVTLGTHIDMANGWVAAPNVKLRYASQWFDGYSESGPSAANAVVGSRQVSIGEATVEFAATKQNDNGATTLRIGYLYRTSFGDTATNVTMLGQSLAVPSFTSDRSALYAGFNKTLHLTNGLDLEFGARGVAGDGFTSGEGNVKLIKRF